MFEKISSVTLSLDIQKFIHKDNNKINTVHVIFFSKSDNRSDINAYLVLFKLQDCKS